MSATVRCFSTGCLSGCSRLSRYSFLLPTFVLIKNSASARSAIIFWTPRSVIPTVPAISLSEADGFIESVINTWAWLVKKVHSLGAAFVGGRGSTLPLCERFFLGEGVRAIGKNYHFQHNSHKTDKTGNMRSAIDE